MNLTVKLHTTLKKFAPPDSAGTIPMEVEEGTTVKDIVASLNIPEDFVGAVFIEGQRAEVDTAVREGMEVNLLAPIGGG